VQLHKVTKIPDAYNNSFLGNYEGVSESTLYVPDLCWRALYMDQDNAPTACINPADHYSPVSYLNPRLLSGDDYTLSQLITGSTNINNLRVTHNLKDIVVAKDIVPEQNIFPVTGNDTVQETKKIGLLYKENKLLAVTINPNFDRYYFKNKDFYDFFIYSPENVIMMKGIQDIFDNSLDINARPVVVNKNNNLAVHYQSPHFAYKIDPSNPTKFYLRISNINTSEPFLIQLNQTFDDNWKIIWVNEKYYDQISCTSKWQLFTITNNEQCQYQDSFINLGDIQLLGKRQVNNTGHFKGNFIGNGWEVLPQDIPSFAKHNNDLYAVIIYQNQIYFSYAIFIAFISLILLAACGFIQEIQSR
jgi:hypothetical protein